MPQIVEVVPPEGDAVAASIPAPPPIVGTSPDLARVVRPPSPILVRDEEFLEAIPNQGMGSHVPYTHEAILFPAFDLEFEVDGPARSLGEPKLMPGEGMSRVVGGDPSWLEENFILPESFSDFKELERRSSEPLLLLIIFLCTRHLWLVH